jgi:nucleotide-binding universal stress UspA family protein
MSIICGTDLSAASASALDVALAFAKLRGESEVVLVHVADEDAKKPALEVSRAKLEEQAKSKPGDIKIRTEMLAGPTDETLVNFCATEATDLLVVAARSKSTAHQRLGTSTAAIIAQTHVPVLAVRNAEPLIAWTNKQRTLRALIAMDDSAVCDLGIQWVHGLRTRGSVEAILGAIYYPDDACDHYGLDQKSMVDSDPEVERLMARDLARRFGGKGKNVIPKPRRGLGRLGDHVVELAREESADIIVIGTTQRTGLGRLGSVSSIVVNDAPQSVVCIPPDAQVPTTIIPVLRSALVATDLSQFSNRAIPYAFAACEPDAEIHIVHIIDEDDEVDVDDVTKTLYSLVPPNAKQKVTAHVVRGDDAAKTIAQSSARLGVDIICMCSHGRSGITRALVGSVADRLLRATRLPVLVLRPA